MTSGVFEYFSSIAVISYAFMLMIFMNAEKNRLIDAFKLLLLAMIFWTGGSLLMRLQFWPTYVFWYHVSLGGMFLGVYAYFRFITAFIGMHKPAYNMFYLILLLGLFIVNIPKGVLIKWPSIQIENEIVKMVYDNLDFMAAIVFTIVGIIGLHVFLLIIKSYRQNVTLKNKITPIILGIMVLFIGNLAIVLPIFRGIPVDIIAGIINAGFLFFTLIKRNLFKLRLIASENVGYLVCVIMGFIAFFSVLPALESVFNASNAMGFKYEIALYLLSYVAIVSLLFAFWKNAITTLFIKEEVHQNEILKNYSANVSKTLELKSIFHSTVKAVVDATDIANVYIGLPDSTEGDFHMRYSYQSLADLSFVLRKDNPIVQWLEKNDELLNMESFTNSASYKSMWENEKFHLMKMKITYCVGLKDNQQLVGVILLSDFAKKVKLKENDLNIIASIGAVASIAIKNAHTYEKAYLEARTDHLTGALNRRYFYEVLNKTFQENTDASLALIIINVDDFKLFNQLYGVKTGDLMLRRIADLIKATVGANNYVARYGGKEFAVILPGYDVFSAKKLTESIRDQIAQLGSEKGEYHQKRLTISAGISVSPYGARTVKELIDNADQAVYQVKRKGKNAIKVFDTFVHASHELEHDLKYLNAYDEYKSTIYALTAAIDAKDHYTFSHSDNVATYATELAMSLKLNSEIVENIRQAALLHDIGKISIPERILNKPGKLTPEEFDVMKGHVEASINIIRHLPSLDYVIPAVLGHHESYDGNGYPRRISGEDIPLTARILCIADAFDAMVSQRCYKDALPLDEAIERLEEASGTQFDPNLVQAFVKMIHSGLVIKEVHDIGRNQKMVSVLK